MMGMISDENMDLIKEGRTLKMVYLGLNITLFKILLKDNKQLFKEKKPVIYFKPNRALLFLRIGELDQRCIS